MDGSPTAPFWPDGYPARHGLGLTLTPAPGRPATPPGAAGMRIHLDRDSLLPKTRPG